MPTFEVTRWRGWYQASCRDLGTTITARRLEQLKVTALCAARKAAGEDAPIVFVLVQDKGILPRILNMVLHSDREGHS